MNYGRQFKYKLCLVGDGAVGKTSLLRKFVYDEFDDSYIVTFGTKTTKKVLVISNPVSTLPTEITFLISDIMGQTDVRNIHDAYFFGASGAIIVCDTTRRETLNNLDTWVAKITKVVGEIPLIMLGNKKDLVNTSEFDIEALERTANTYDCPGFLTSAKTGENVEETFRHLAELILLKKTGNLSSLGR